MSSPFRVRVFAASVAFYTIGVCGTVLTDVPSGMCVSVVLVAAAAWAFGARAGLVAAAVDLAVGGVLLGTGVLTMPVRAVAVLVPVAVTDVVVLAALVALRRAELRRDATEGELRRKNAELETALSEVRELRGMLPICAWCKSVRDVDGMWDRLEGYLARHSRATFTHSICPTCLARVTAETQGLPPTG